MRRFASMIAVVALSRSFFLSPAWAVDDAKVSRLSSSVNKLVLWAGRVAGPFQGFATVWELSPDRTHNHIAKFWSNSDPTGYDFETSAKEVERWLEDADLFDEVVENYESSIERFRERLRLLESQVAAAKEHFSKNSGPFLIRDLKSSPSNEYFKEAGRWMIRRAPLQKPKPAPIKSLGVLDNLIRRERQSLNRAVKTLQELHLRQAILIWRLQELWANQAKEIETEEGSEMDRLASERRRRVAEKLNDVFGTPDGDIVDSESLPILAKKLEDGRQVMMPKQRMLEQVQTALQLESRLKVTRIKNVCVKILSGIDRAMDFSIKKLERIQRPVRLMAFPALIVAGTATGVGFGKYVYNETYQFLFRDEIEKERLQREEGEKRITAIRDYHAKLRAIAEKSNDYNKLFENINDLFASQYPDESVYIAYLYMTGHTQQPELFDSELDPWYKTEPIASLIEEMKKIFFGFTDIDGNPVYGVAHKMEIREEIRELSKELAERSKKYGLKAVFENFGVRDIMAPELPRHKDLFPHHHEGEDLNIAEFVKIMNELGPEEVMRRLKAGPIKDDPEGPIALSGPKE